MKSGFGVPGFGTQSDLPAKTVTICVPVHAPGLKNSLFTCKREPARMRALEDGRDDLRWVGLNGTRQCLFFRAIKEEIPPPSEWPLPVKNRLPYFETTLSV